MSLLLLLVDAKIKSEKKEQKSVKRSKQKRHQSRRDEYNISKKEKKEESAHLPKIFEVEEGERAG